MQNIFCCAIKIQTNEIVLNTIVRNRIRENGLKIHLAIAFKFVLRLTCYVLLIIQREHITEFSNLYFYLLGEEHEATVHTSDGPEPLMRTSWMQLARLDAKHIGMYYCIANNSIGEASTSSVVSML